MEKPKIVTHSAGFHADDVFAVATLLLYLKKDLDEIEIIRTRDSEEIDRGDYVVDVGFVYDPEKRRFDHHQKESAGARVNGIKYASFGLVWKEYGKEVSGDEETWGLIDKILVQPVDALDTGTDLCQSKIDGVYPYAIQFGIGSFEPRWGSSQEEFLTSFKKAVSFAKEILENEIRHTKQKVSARPHIVNTYENTEDKRVIVFDDVKGWPRDFISRILFSYPEPLFFLREHLDSSWQVICVQGPEYITRKKLPEAWSGLEHEEFQKVSGVPDAIFCHKERFLCVVKSKEGALELVRQALEA